MFDRRGFLAAAGAVSLAGCAPTKRLSARILYSDGPGTTGMAVLRLFAKALAKVGVDASVETIPRGAGKMAAQMLAEGPRDGSLLGQMFTGLIYAEFLSEQPVRHPLSSFEWIGNYGGDCRILLVSAKSGVTRFAELRNRATPITIPAASLQGPGYIEPTIIRYLTGAKIKVVPGFAGGTRKLAVISGEVDGTVGTLDTMATLLDLPGTRILLRTSGASLPPGTAGVPPGGVPALRDVARGPDAEPLLMLVESYAQLGRMLALPPGTPAPILAQWRQRFATVMADPDFLKEIAAAHYEVQARPGDVVAAQLHALSARHAEIAPALRRAIAG